MLEPAISYQDELNKEILNTAFDERYKYFHQSYSDVKVDLKDSTWDRIQFVSVHDKHVSGYLSATVRRPENFISCIVAINFNLTKKLKFGKDMYEFIDTLLNKFNFPKIKFYIVCGNPIEKSWDLMVKNFGGRIVGIFKDDTLLHDNKYYDVKHYEIYKK